MGQVVIGVDPAKRSHAIEVIDEWERTLAAGVFGNDNAGYRQMRTIGRRFPQRLWAVEGANGIGRQLAQRLVADGETVVDVPAKLSTRVRAMSTGHGRKTDPVDARAVAIVALRNGGLTGVTPDDDTVALRLLSERRRDLVRTRTQTVNRLHQLLLELVPAGAQEISPLPEPGHCSPRCDHATSPTGPAGSSPPTTSRTSPTWTGDSNGSRSGSPRRWRRPAPASPASLVSVR